MPETLHQYFLTIVNTIITIIVLDSNATEYRQKQDYTHTKRKLIIATITVSFINLANVSLIKVIINTRNRNSLNSLSKFHATLTCTQRQVLRR